MTRDARPVLLVSLAFLTSGFTSLVLQVVWFKSLALILGNTLYAMSTVVSVFLAGLAIGASLAGRLSPRIARPLVGYGLLEVGVGLYALASLPLLAALDPIVGFSYARFGAASPLYVGSRIALSAILLLPPTILMGATLPWLVAWATRSGRSFGKSLGFLYGLNTFGAVLGAATAGFALIPNLGVSRTSHLVGFIALAVGALLVGVGLREPATAGATMPAPPAGRGPVRTPKAALVLVGVSGAVALVLEVAWARAFALIFGSSVYSFALVLASYLLGIALGSLLWGGRLGDGRRPWLAFSALQAALALGIGFGLVLLPNLPEHFISVLIVSRHNLPAVYLTQAALAGSIALLPCLALGALFPVGARLLGMDGRSAGESTGLAYSVNTVGTVTGTLLAGFVLLPGPGMRVTLVGSAVVAVLLAVYAWWSDPDRAPRGAGAKKKAKPRRAGAGSPLEYLPFGLAAAALALAFLAPPWNRGLLTLGLYRSADATRGTGLGAVQEEIQARLADEVLLFYREGLYAVVSVHTVRSAPGHLTIRVNGKPDAGTGLDMVTQAMVGHVPMVWAGPGSDVCVIGHGSGVSASAVLANDPKSLTIVEIEPAVIQASRLFDAVTERVLDDPRVNLILEDGRQYLQRTEERYDLVISEPPNPWVAGVNNLFTVEFYERVKRCLRPEGVFCGWLQTYELSPEALSSLLHAVHAVFPRSEIFLFDRDIVIVSSLGEAKVPSARLLDVSRRTPARAYLSRFGYDADGFVAAHHLGSIADMLPRLPSVPINRDDLPYVEYRAPFDLFRIASAGMSFDPDSAGSSTPVAGLERWIAAEGRDSVVAGAIRVLAGRGDVERGERMLDEAAGAKLLAGPTVVELRSQLERGRAARLARADVAAARAAIDNGDVLTAETRVERALEIDPRNGLAHIVAGRIAMRHEALAEARRHLEQALAFGSLDEQCLAWMNLGIVEMREGKIDAGRAAFERAVLARPGEAEAYVNLARWYASAGAPDSVRAVLDRGRRVAFPVLPVDAAFAAFTSGQPF